jgi:hypothetical protein
MKVIKELLARAKALVSREPECEMLPLPYTFPDNGSAYQLLSVVEDMNDECKMHVELADSMDYAESWGAYLANVARVIARDHADHLDTVREDGDLFAALCDGFNGTSDPKWNYDPEYWRDRIAQAIARDRKVGKQLANFFDGIETEQPVKEAAE